MSHLDKDKKRKTQRLVDVECTHVSLVDRPANRTPFKAIKRDEEPKGATPMNITLKNMFGKRDPEVTSVIAASKDKAVAVAKALMTADEVTVTEQDGVFIARKSGTAPSADEQVVHLGKNTGVAYTVANLRKELSLYDTSSENFDETLKSQGFVPGLYVGVDALMMTIQNAAMAEDTSSPDAFRAKVTKAIEDFSAYVDNMIGALPLSAFKFEKALVAIAPNDLAAISRPADGFNAEVYDAIFGKPDAAGAAGEAAGATESAAGATPATDGAEAGKSGEAAQAAPVAAGEAGEAGTEGQVATAPAAAAAEPAPANLEELPKGTPETEPATQEQIMAGIMEGLTKSMGETIAAAMKPLTDRLDAQEASIQKMSKAVGGTIASTPEEDDDNVVRLSKGDSAPRSGGDIPLMDTAYRTHRQKG